MEKFLTSDGNRDIFLSRITLFDIDDQKLIWDSVFFDEVWIDVYQNRYVRTFTYPCCISDFGLALRNLNDGTLEAKYSKLLWLDSSYQNYAAFHSISSMNFSSDARSSIGTLWLKRHGIRKGWEIIYDVEVPLESSLANFPEISLETNRQLLGDSIFSSEGPADLDLIPGQFLKLSWADSTWLAVSYIDVDRFGLFSNRSKIIKIAKLTQVTSP